MRMCCDYRGLNSVTVPSFFPMTSFTEVIDCFAERKPYYLTSLDLRQGYLQVPISPPDVEKTAFVTHQGQFRYNYLSFGLSGGPATFQRLMQHVFHGMTFDYVMCYLDDILVFSGIESGIDGHLSYLQKVFDRLRDANLKLHPSKCFICRSGLDFLGHRIDREGLHVLDDKIKIVREIPTPKTVKQHVHSSVCVTFTVNLF